MRFRVMLLASLAGVGTVLAVVLALVANAATSSGRWPGPADWLRRDPWLWVAVLGTLSAVAAVVAVWGQERLARFRHDPPSPGEPGVPDWFVDRDQVHVAVEAVCGGDRAVGITTSLSGAGGFGKSTIAMAVCTDRRVRRAFRDRVYMVTIGREMRGRAATAAKVAEVTRFITGDAAEFGDPNLAGAHLGRLLDQRPRTLLVLDDVWDDEQLAPFLHGGQQCVRLVTTRNPSLLPDDAHRIVVDEMSDRQARAVLTWRLSPLSDAVVTKLIQVCGRWALLLRLANRQIAEQVATGVSVESAAEQLLVRLRTSGPAAVDDPVSGLDLDDPSVRNRQVTASVEAAATLLRAGDADRFAELGAFAEDEDIPVSLIALLWRVTGGLTDAQSRGLCGRLTRLSLITMSREGGGTVTLHDVVRDYLRNRLGEDGLLRVNGKLVDALSAPVPPAASLAPAGPDPGHAWWQAADTYLLDHLVDHLIAAGRTSEAEAVAGDLRWVEVRLAQRGPSAPWSDLARIGTPHALPLARSIAQAAHLLSPIDPEHSLVSILHSRLHAYPHWHDQVIARRGDPALRPCLANHGALPDVPRSGLRRVLTGHRRQVQTVAISPDGTWIATGSEDATVRIWDPESGGCISTLTGHTDFVESIAIAPDGTWIATTSADQTVRIWDRATGSCITTLTGHRGGVTSVAISPDGTWMATGERHGVRIWDPRTWTCSAAFGGHAGYVTSVAISPDGSWLATAASDGKARIWDSSTRMCTKIVPLPPPNIEFVSASVAISHDGTWLAVSAGSYFHLWDRATESVTTFHLRYGTHGPAAISPDSTWLAASDLRNVRIWNREIRDRSTGLADYGGPCLAVAISPDGSWMAMAGPDNTTRIWDSPTLAEIEAPTQDEDFDYVEPIVTASSPDGSWFAVVDNGSLEAWDAESASRTSVITDGLGRDPDVAISPDGTRIATIDTDGMRIWNRATGTCALSLNAFRNPLSSTSLVISPDNTWLAADDHGDIQIWDLVTGSLTAVLTREYGLHFEWHADEAAISSDGTWLAYVDGNSVLSWNRETGDCETIFGIPGTTYASMMQSVAISPDDTWLATTDDNRLLRIWDRATGACTAILAAHVELAHPAGPVNLDAGSEGHPELADRHDRADFCQFVAISPDGRFLATATSTRNTTATANTVLIWSVAEKRVVAAMRVEVMVSFCSWSNDGRKIAVHGGRPYLFDFLPSPREET